MRTVRTMTLPVALSAAVAVAVTALTASCARTSPPPEAQADPDPVVIDGPDDFVAVAQGAVDEAKTALPAIAHCIGGVTITAEWDLDDRAEYADGVIRVRVPATAPRIEEVMVHEIAHHLDARCPAVDEVRPAFLAALSTDAPWTEGPTWAETPAEQFAEAVTQVVLGRRRAVNVAVPAEALEVVRGWAAPDFLPPEAPENN